MSMTALERKAALRAAATMKQMTMASTAKKLGVSYNHLTLVLAGEREASTGLKIRIAAFIGAAVTHVFPDPRAPLKSPKARDPDSPPPRSA